MKAVINLIKSFGYAFKGLLLCVKKCRNFRIHMVAAVTVIYFSRYFDLTPNSYAVLFLTFALVLCAEAFNCAIEYVCDDITTQYSENIKKAKDTAAGAVLVCALFSVFIAITLFFKPAVLIDIFNSFYSSPVKLILLLVYITICAIFIFYEDILKYGKK